MIMPLLKKLQIENRLLKEDLNNLIPSVPGEGENITLNGTAEARFKNFLIKGNSKQETREGYNLTDPNQFKAQWNVLNISDGEITSIEFKNSNARNIYVLANYTNTFRSGENIYYENKS